MKSLLPAPFRTWSVASGSTRQKERGPLLVPFRVLELGFGLLEFLQRHFNDWLRLVIFNFCDAAFKLVDFLILEESQREYHDRQKAAFDGSHF